MNLDKALELTMPYIRYLAHDSRLYDYEDIVQEGMIATWLTLKKLDPDIAEKAKVAFLRQAIRWRVDNFIMSNLVHVKISRTTLRKLIKNGVDVVAKYRALPCGNFDGRDSKELSPYYQACFNEGLSKVNKKCKRKIQKKEVSKYI